MTISFTKRRLFWPILMFSNFLLAQDNLIAFWQPQVSLNYKVVKDYSHNFYVANRNFVYSESELLLDVRQLDLGHFSKLKIRDDQSLSLGVMWRGSNLFDGDRINEVRLTTQYNITNAPFKWRYGHRLRAEQRIFNGLPTIYRFRYRLAVDFPLEGDQLDIGEAFSVLGAEPILSVANDFEPLYSFRLRSGIGWKYSLRSSLQFVLEYRLVNYTRATAHVLLLETSLDLGF